jgi:hypothetical protein
MFVGDSELLLLKEADWKLTGSRKKITKITKRSQKDHIDASVRRADAMGRKFVIGLTVVISMLAGRGILG